MQPPVRAVIAQDSSREIADGVSRFSVGRVLTSFGSIIALVASGISLWETALKEPDLRLFPGSNIAFVGDETLGHALAVPLTILNSGARDGVVLAFELTLRDDKTGWVKHFQSSYVANPTYFADEARSKMAFSPLAILGRSSYTATLVFYPKSWDEKFEDTYEAPLTLTLDAVTAPPAGWLDQLLQTPPHPVTLALAYKNNDVMYHMTQGEVRLLQVRAAAAETAAPIAKP